MNKNVQRVFLLTTLLVVLVGLGALSAADVSDNTTTTQNIAQDTPSTSTQVAATVSDTNDNKIVTDTKTAKTASKAKNVTKDTQTNKNNVQSTTKTMKTETTENTTTETNTTENTDEIGWYNSTNWEGSPTIDAENNKITMQGSTIAYFKQHNIQELQTVTANLYHGTRNGQKTFGLYNPETQKWIGYVTDGTTMKQGINQETGYSTSTNVLDSDVWLIDGSEKPYTIDVSDGTNVKMTYTAADGTTTPIVVIPVGTSNLSGYYLAFQDNGRVGMYITNVTTTNNTINITTENKTDEKENNTIVYGTGNDTSIWAMANGDTVPTSNITVDDVTEVAIMAGTEYDNTYLNSTISPNGSYALNMQIYLSSASGYIALPFIVSPVTKQSSGQAQKLFEYTHENGYGWQYSSKNGIAKGETYKIPDHKWVSLNFTIINGSVSVSYNNQTVDLGNVITQDCYFSMRKWGSGSVGVKEIELSKLEEKTFDWYNSTSWTGNPTIDTDNNKITMRENRVTYYSQYNIQELQTVTANLYHGTSNGQKTFGLYNPETQKWIGYVTDGTTMKQGINQETGYSTSTNVLDSDVWLIDGSEKAFTIDVSDGTNVKITYTAADGTTTPVVVIPVGTSDLSGYYLAFQDNGRSGMYITNVTTTTNTINTTTNDTNTTTNDTNTTENILDIDWYNIDYWDYDHWDWRDYPKIDVANKKVSMHYNSQTYFKQYNAKELFNAAIDNTIYLIHYNGNPSSGEKVGFYKPDSQGWIYFNAEYPIKKETPVSIRLDGDKLIYTYTSRNGTENTTGEVSLNGTDLSEYYLGFHDYYGEGGMYVKNLSIIQAAPKLNTTLSIDTIADAKFDDKITITGKLTDINNTNIANANVTVTVNNVEYNVTTGEDGTYTVSDVPAVLGVNNVTVTYNGNNSYNKAADIQTTFNGLKHDTLLAADTIASVKYGGNIAITGKLTDNNTNTGINDAEITVTVNGESHNVKTGTDGTYTVSDVPVVAGVNNVTVTYNGDDTYNKAADLQTTFTGLPHDTTLSLYDISNRTFGSTVNVTGNIFDADNYYIPVGAGEAVTVTINGVVYSAVTDSQGAYTIYNVSVLPGENTAVAAYNGSTLYNKAADVQTKFTGLSHDTTVTVDTINDTYADTVNITGKLADVNSTAIADANITVTVNNVNYPTTTDATGTYTVNVPASIGTNNVTVKYNGDEKYNKAADIITTFNGLARDTATTVNPVNGYVGHNITITANVNSNEGTVIFTTSNGTVLGSADVTNGTATITIVFNRTVNDAVIANYNGTNKYNPSTANNTININKIDTKLTVTPVNDTAVGNRISITGQLTDIDNNPISSAQIAVIVNGARYTGITNDNGTFTTRNVPVQINENTIVLNYTGNTRYNNAVVNTTFNGLKAETVITADNITAELGSTVTLNATIKDANGNSITNGTVLVKINGKSNGYANITNGEILYNLTLTPEQYGKGSYTITYVYSETSTALAARTNTTLQVTPYTPKVTLAVNTTDIGDNVLMVVTVTNGNGYSALSGNIKFKLNGITYKINKEPVKVQVNNGTAILSFYASRKFIGNNNITILYSGNGKFDSIAQNFTNILTINQYKETVINTAPITAKLGHNITINTKITDKNGNPLTQGVVAIKINGKTFGHANITNGTINYTQYLDPSKFSAKNYTITIKFGGKGKYSPAQANTTLIINKNTPTITYNKITVNNGTTARITATIKDGNLNANNGTVGLKINGNTYKVNKQPVIATPDSNGIVTFNVPTSNLQTNNNLTFTYSGYRVFNGIKTTITNAVTVRN